MDTLGIDLDQNEALMIAQCLYWLENRAGIEPHIEFQALHYRRLIERRLEESQYAAGLDLDD